ncbi:MAG: FAD-dependent oxidoreductase [Planctomycetota bacterium]|nr:FAD-dependent oxidoreductase [Planctomycetota bacterium]
MLEHDMTALPDAIIIGGGPAGSSAAFHLARAGRHVILLEAKPFPRIKVCGECISPAAATILEAMVPPSTLRAAGAHQVRDFVLRRGGRAHAWTMPAPTWVLSRAALDTLLLDAARAAGAIIRQPARARAVRMHDDRAQVELDSGETLAARIVVHADGQGRLDAAPPTPARPGVVGFKCHFDPGPNPVAGLHMHAAPGAYLGVVQVEAALATAAFVVRTELVRRAGGSGDQLLADLMPHYRPETRRSPWLTCGVARGGYQPGNHPRSFRIGNAAAAVEPVGGEGIGLALWAGSALERALSHSQPGNPPDAQAILARAYRRRLALRSPACAAAAWTLMHDWPMRTVWPILSTPRMKSALLAPWYALLGKSPAHAPPLFTHDSATTAAPAR